jgi:hypothetical protein
MSAVIWFGIVAVWAFVLIPTWVRRSDIHWRRSGDASTTRDKLGHAARVISRPASRRFSTARTTVPAMRRPVTSTRRTTTVRAASASSAGTRSVSVLERDDVMAEARTETLPVVGIDEPPTQQMPAVGRVVPQTHQAAPSSSVLDDEDRQPAGAATTTEHASSAQAADAAATEVPMTTPRTARPAPRRSAQAPGKPVPPHVQRARRLVWIGATALATLLLAVLFGGWWIVLNLLADVALVGYLRYLRGIAKQQLARKARTQTARAETRAPAGPRTSERVARPQRRPAAPRHRAETAPVRASAATETVAATATAAPVESPEVIDLTDGAMSDDCPTTELTVARAV